MDAVWVREQWGSVLWFLVKGDPDGDGEAWGEVFDGGAIDIEIVGVVVDAFEDGVLEVFELRDITGVDAFNAHAEPDGLGFVVHAIGGIVGFVTLGAWVEPEALDGELWGFGLVIKVFVDDGVEDVDVGGEDGGVVDDFVGAVFCLIAFERAGDALAEEYGDGCVDLWEVGREGESEFVARGFEGEGFGWNGPELMKESQARIWVKIAIECFERRVVEPRLVGVDLA